MKKTFLVILCFIFPYCAYGQLDVYLSSDWLSYGRDVWTSTNYPDAWSNQIEIHRNFPREEFPPEYNKTQGEIKSLVDDLFPALSEQEKQEYFNSLINFHSQNFPLYIAISISPDTQTHINDKQSIPFLLSSFESTFQSCAIDLSDRQGIARTLITDIHNDTYANIDEVRYSDIRYGDCIIPFPDQRRWSTTVSDSFPSNRLIAESLAWNHLRFWVLEDSVNLFSLSDIVLGASYEWVQDNNLLSLQSSRVEQDVLFDKQVGKSKILFAHQNHYKNIFNNTLVSWDSTSWYVAWWEAFTLGHPLFIRSGDSEEDRELSWWQEMREWIYSKTLIQEDTFTTLSGVHIPNQSVGVTTYYAIVYNYDTSPPECPATLFSHESAGNENFIFPENPWFPQTKYGYFVCSDEQSGCFCDTSTNGCFVRDDEVLSIPQSIPHAWRFGYRFWNQVWLSLVCNSPENTEFFYDRVSPDVNISLPGISQGALVKEYVNNNWVLHDGEGARWKRLYNITNELSFQASDALSMSIELYDMYNGSLTEQWVSWLNSYSLIISRFEDDNWVERIRQEDTFGAYNPSGIISVSDTHAIDFTAMENIQSIFTRAWEYQVYIEFDDVAGNQSRVVFHFEIIPWDVDPWNSSLEVMQRNTMHANDNDYYRYTLTMNDEYLNPVAWKNISSIAQSCAGVFPCLELRNDMSSVSPSWPSALRVFDVDSVSNSGWIVRFSVASKVPGEFTESFIVNTSNPVETLRFSEWENSFTYPVIGTLEASVSWSWVSDTLPVWEISDYRVRIEDLESSGYSWSLSNFSSFLSWRHPDTDFTPSWLFTQQADGVYFSWTFTSTLAEWEEHKTMLEIIEWNTSWIGISYNIWGQNVSYKLSSSSQSWTILELWNTGELENPVKVIGNLQWVWNNHNLDERQNMTDIDTHVFRNILRKNVWKNLHLREHDTIVWGVKYIDKTLDLDKEYILESNPWFETLIVRNGNIHITENFNQSWNTVGLISYIDAWYNEETGYSEVWNIYVEPEVVSISGLIYADGWIISTNGWNPISWDVSLRNSVLQQQLTIMGSLFTRNTLAWGRELAGDYILPWGEVTSQQSLATQYDLYYTRRWNTGCTLDSYGFCDIREYLIIEYDPRALLSPPRFFDMK